MINASHKILKNLAALVWILGGMILFINGYSLLKQANNLSENFIVIVAMLILAFVVGMIKNKFIMSKFCIKNLLRIEALDKPKIYQFYELKFFFFLTLMILTGAFLSRIAADNYYGLLGVGALDLALSTALLKSSVLFFKKD